MVVEPIIQEKIGTIFLPDQAKKKESNSFGRVISVGPENKDGLKDGDTVCFRRNEGTVVEDKYLCLAAKWILGVVS